MQTDPDFTWGHKCLECGYQWFIGTNHNIGWATVNTKKNKTRPKKVTHSQQSYWCLNLSINEGKISAGREVVTLETIQLPSIPQEVSLVWPHTFFYGCHPNLNRTQTGHIVTQTPLLFTVPHFAVFSACNY